MTNTKDSNHEITNIAVHPFERNGLGKAPFRFVGMGQQDRLYGEVILNRAEYQRTWIALTTTEGGTCAYCGTAIKKLYNVESSDGKTFHVGCDCIMKVGDHKLIRAVKLADRENAKKVRAAKAVSDKAELQAILRDEPTRDKLRAIPYGRYTMLESAEWFFVCAGATGRAKILKAIKKALSAL